MTTLAANSRLAALVEELRLGIEYVTDRKSLDWTRRNIRILHICPNVNYVKIRGFNCSLQDALTDVLKEKSLISFHITTRFLSGGQPYVVHSLKLFELMRRWPNLRSISINGLKCITELDDLVNLNTPDLPFRCLDLQEINIMDDVDCGEVEFLHYLRGISRSIKTVKLKPHIYIKSEADLQTLSECLSSWSSTLECLYMYIESHDFSSNLLWETLSNLNRLRELQFYERNLDFGSIATLPQLEQLKFYDAKKEGISIFTSYLEDKEKFPALKYIGTYTCVWRRYIFEQMEHVLLDRAIQLEYL